MISWIFKKNLQILIDKQTAREKKVERETVRQVRDVEAEEQKKEKKRGEKWVRVDGGFWWDKEEGTAAAAATVTTAARS